MFYLLFLNITLLLLKLSLSRWYSSFGNVQKVAVIGSGLTGLETAELLVDKGNTVTVVEMADKIGPGIIRPAERDV